MMRNALDTLKPASVLSLLLCLSGCGQAVHAQAVTWNPLAQQQVESDTLFMPDLTSARTIDAAGGFFTGSADQSEADISARFDFGPGKFGPAVRGKPSEYGKPNFVYYPVDGFMPSNEFTLEFWARSDSAWSSVTQNTPLFAVVSLPGNSLHVMVQPQNLVVQASALGWNAQWHSTLSALHLEDTRWHSIALTLKQGVITIFIDGTDAGQIANVHFLPIWSSTPTSNQGIDIGGLRANNSAFWISDVRISRAARIPGRPVSLQTLESVLKVDTATTDARTLTLQVGGLHPYGTPEQISSAMSVVRTDKFLGATPIIAGPPDPSHPSVGHSGKFSYDWQVVDHNLEWYQTHHVDAYFNFDSTPALLGGTHPPLQGDLLRTQLSRAAPFNTEPPSDMNAWAAVVSDTVYHIRVEKQMNISWYGVWNEPTRNGAFWHGTLEQYLDLYAVTARAIRSVDPAARIGGPEGAPPKWTQELIAKCAVDKLPLDYISYHYFTGELASIYDFRRFTDVATQAAGLKTPMPIVIGEFNWDQRALYNPNNPQPIKRDLWHVRALTSAYLTSALNLMAQTPGYDLLVFAHIGSMKNSVRDGGWNVATLLGPQNQQYAPYNALKGWKQTVGQEILNVDADLLPGVTALATRDPGDGRIGLVLASYGFSQRRPRSISISLSHLPAGRFELSRAQVDPRHSSRWDLAEDRNEGAVQNDLQIVEQRSLTVENNSPLNLEIDLPYWSSVFITLKRMK